MLRTILRVLVGIPLQTTHEYDAFFALTDMSIGPHHLMQPTYEHGDLLSF